MKQIKIGLLGFGTVGTGVSKLIEQQNEELKQRLQAELVIEKVLVRDASKKRDCSLAKEVFTTDVNEITTHSDIDIVVEVMGGVEHTKEYVKQALSHQKHVVTANKDMLSLHLKELSELAKQNKVGLLFEASVGGAIPVIHSMTSTMSGDKITEIMGIMNGTTNYMLTKMTEEGLGFDEVLKEAQELGYAESDPTSDVDGLDASRKIAVLASLGFHTEVTFDQVYTQGIRNISPKDIDYAKQWGYRIKLVGVAKDNNGIEVRVHPMMLKENNLLSQVKDSFNAICLKGIGFGDSLLYGRGAGELPTGSAVLGDVMEIADSIVRNSPMKSLVSLYRDEKIVPMDAIVSKAFLRLQKTDVCKDWSKIEEVCRESGVSVLKQLEEKDEWVLAVESKEKDRTHVLDILQQRKMIAGCNSMIRMEGE
ncbi:homoserine dehydrogenase [Filifactor alocis]